MELNVTRLSSDGLTRFGSIAAMTPGSPLTRQLLNASNSAEQLGWSTAHINRSS
jgi:hypothetical protein